MPQDMRGVERNTPSIDRLSDVLYRLSLNSVAQRSYVCYQLRRVHISFQETIIEPQGFRTAKGSKQLIEPLGVNMPAKLLKPATHVCKINVNTGGFVGYKSIHLPGYMGKRLSYFLD